MNAYQAKRAAKLERYRQYAENATGRALAAYRRSRDILDAIRPGESILICHHSEEVHRSAVIGSANAMRLATREARTAAYWKQHADAIEFDASIHDKDSEAVVNLREKIARIEDKQGRRNSNDNANLRRYTRRIDRLTKGESS